jgi:hypothetical protein
VDTDILKPNTGYVSIERPSQVSSSKDSSEPPTTGVITPDDEQPAPYAEPVSEDEDEDVMDIGLAKDEEKRTGLTGQQVAEAIAFREKMLKERDSSPPSNIQDLGRKRFGNDLGPEDDDDEADERTPLLQNTNASSTKPKAKAKPRTLSIDPLALSSTFDQTLRERLRGAQDEQEAKDAPQQDSEREDQNGHPDGSTSAAPGDEPDLIRDWMAPPGKRIAVPVRIEPKVYFATERTFLVSYCCLGCEDWFLT